VWEYGGGHKLSQHKGQDRSGGWPAGDVGGVFGWENKQSQPTLMGNAGHRTT